MCDERKDYQDLQNVVLHVGDETDICSEMRDDDFGVDEPGPSGLQQTHNLSLSEADSLDVMLAEVEDSALDSNFSVVTNTKQDRPINVSVDNLNTLLAINEAFRETLGNLIWRVTLAISKNREAQKLCKTKLRQTEENGLRATIKRVPISRFVYPYFRDSHDMEAPKNKEYELKVIRREYDPLVKDEKKWSAKECQLLASGVRKSLIENRIQPFLRKKEMLNKKIRDTGQETSSEQIMEWKNAVDEQDRLIAYHKNLPDNEIMTGDYSEVDWAKIAKVDFLGNRTPRQLRLKWINEQCPRWSKDPWTPNELNLLRQCAEQWNNWNVIAERLGTKRTAFQCFVKFKSELEIENIGRSWTKEEDAHLMTLAHCMQVNGKMHWDKISHYMEERSRQQCSIRYRRALDTNIKFGRWDTSEDVLLTCAVSRFGTKDWIKVASFVPGRSDAQCRDRWVNVLDKSIKVEPWSVDEDEKLLEGIRIFGKGEWSRISTMIPGRSAAHCKTRFRSLLSAKVKLASDRRPYPFRRFNWKGKFRRQEVRQAYKQFESRFKMDWVEAAFKKLLASDGEGGLAEQIMNSFDMRALSVDEMKEISAMSSKQRIKVMQFLNEVQEKQSQIHVEDKQTVWKLINDKLHFDSSLLDASTKSALLKYYKRLLKGCSNNTDLLTNDEKREFELRYRILQEADDSKAVQEHVLNGLCDLIERNDNFEYCKKEANFNKCHILNELEDYLNSVLIVDVNSAVARGTDAFTLPPCIGTLQLYENIQRQYCQLREAASRLFEPIDPDVDDNIFLQLSRQITLDPEYVLFKMKMRTLLFWPMLLYRSIEVKESVERRIWLRTVADVKLKEQQKRAVEALNTRVRGNLEQQQNLDVIRSPEEIFLAQQEVFHDHANELTVGDYLKKKMSELPRRHYIAKRKQYIKNAATVSVNLDKESEAMSQRIEESIEAVRTAVNEIYERDFVIPASAYDAAAKKIQEHKKNIEIHDENDSVKDALDDIVDKVAHAETIKNANTGLRQRKGKKQAVKNQAGRSVSRKKREIPTGTASRKRKSKETTERCGGAAKKSKRKQLNEDGETS